jgi:hypothetical protein
MPPRKATTRRSTRAPKLKEPEVGEGSSPRSAKQLEFTLRPKPVIKTSMKKAFIQPLTFGDTEARIGSKTTLPHWGELFKKIRREEYPKYIPHSDPYVRVLDDEVFPNIRRSYLHMVARRTPVFPYIELLKWLIDHTYTHKCLINDENGGCVGVFLLVEVQKYYKLRDPKERLNTDFVVKFYEHHNMSQVMASWWREDNKYTNRSTGWYRTTNLREPYIYLMALLSRLYGEKDCSIFSEAWMPLDYKVAISRSSFNWGAIISKQLSICIQQAQTLKEGETPAFYMASYLVHVMCARNIFVAMNLSWHVAELPIHVYFNILWENRYNNSYSLICDEFIACIYFILFKKECPRLSIATEKMISKVGHWYLDERDTYIRVLEVTGAPHLLSTHVLEWLVVGEICYQTILQGYKAILVKDKKQVFIPYGFHVGLYLVKDTTQAKQEGMRKL